MTNLRCLGLVMMMVGGLMVQACGRGPVEETPPSDPNIIAVFNGGEVTRDDLDRAVLSRAPGDRDPDSGDPEGWYRTIIEDILLERLLLADPDIDPALIESRLGPLRQEESHRLVAAIYLDRHLPEAEPVTEADALKEYEKHRGRWVQKGRREVRNIFLRSGGRNSDAGLAQTAAEIRRRYDRGESFAALAEQYSDSESRHQGGVIGWLEADRLDPALAEIVFSLEERRLSESMTTPQGVHLFLVTGILEEREITFSEARGQIEERLSAQRREALVEQLAAGLPEVQGAYVADGAELAALMRHGEAEAEVVRIGDFGLSLAQLKAMMKNAVADGRAASGDLAGRLVEVLARREQIFAAARTEGLDRDPKVEARLEEVLDGARLNHRRQVTIERVLDGDPELLSVWFEANQERFSTPVRLKVSRLLVPLEVSSVETIVAALENLSRGEVSPGDFDEVAERLGGRVEHDGWKTLNELAAIRPMAARLASTLAIGRVSPPYRTLSTLEVLTVEDRQEPGLQTLAAVYDRARSEYLAGNAAELFGRWANASLAEAGLRIFSERLVELDGERQVPSGD
ncbi:MAG: peptidylprolyl isomerase [Acidobacteriota bacterium]